MKRAVFLFLVLLLSPPNARPQPELGEMTARGQAPGDSIGFTYYDYLTNGSAFRCLINFGDGQMSFARTAAVDSMWTTFGTYYKFFDGVSWSTDWNRIEKARTGFSSIDQFQDAGGVEVILSSQAVAVDAARGAGVWSTTLFPCAVTSAPRLAIRDGFTIHTVGLTEMPERITYHRSFDAGATWSCDEYVVNQEGAVAEADAYDITAWEDHVAIVVAGAGGDVVVAESSDQGTTWTETVIYDIDETLLTEGEEPPDGSCSILYDDDGELHVAWGSYLSAGDGTYVESTDAGIRYWSPQAGVTEVAWPVDDPTIVNPGGRDGNFASQPDITLLDGTEIIIIYSSLISERDSRGNNYEHVFATWICNGSRGFSWDATEGSGFDAAFPSVADRGDDDNITFTYTADRFAGNAVRGVHEPIPVGLYVPHGRFPPLP